MRLATFNILSGRSLADGLVSTERLAEACRSLDADVLCLQEVDRGQARSGGVDQTAAIGAGRFEAAIIGEPGGVWRAAVEGEVADAPGYGVAIVAAERVAVEAWHVLRLKAAPVKSPVFVPGGKGRFILLPDEPRVVLAADLGELVVATTHLSFVPGYNLAQVRRAARWLAGLGKPCILLGDLNAPGALPRWAAGRGWRSLVKAKTFPADRPTFQLDHVLAWGEVPAVRHTEVRQLPLSDHRAVIVEVGSG